MEEVAGSTPAAAINKEVLETISIEEVDPNFPDTLVGLVGKAPV